MGFQFWNDDKVYEAEEFFEEMERRYKAKPWHYKMKLTFSRWWRYGWLYQLRPSTNWRRAKYFIQRGRRGWSIPDTWSLDDYLAGVIGPSLRHLAHATHGWPGEGSRWKTYEDWRDYLVEIADAFDDYKRHWEWEMEGYDSKMSDEAKRAHFKWSAGRLENDVKIMARILEPDVWPSLWD